MMWILLFPYKMSAYSLTIIALVKMSYKKDCPICPLKALFTLTLVLAPLCTSIHAPDRCWWWPRCCAFWYAASQTHRPHRSFSGCSRLYPSNSRTNRQQWSHPPCFRSCYVPDGHSRSSRSLASPTVPGECARNSDRCTFRANFPAPVPAPAVVGHLVAFPAISMWVRLLGFLRTNQLSTDTNHFVPLS